ncbi:MAG: bactofilin family protein [Spirochaetota bacterium]
MAKKIIQINKNPVYDFGMISTVFGDDTEFYGDLHFTTSLQINGYFEGEIVSEKGNLVIGKGGTVKANVKARSVIIDGTIHGNIEASCSIEIRENGKLFGNIRTSKLKIADGVVFEGNCEMIKQSEEEEAEKNAS